MRLSRYCFRLLLKGKMHTKRLHFSCIVFISILLISPAATGQSDSINVKSEAVNKSRLNGLIIGGSALYAGSMTGLYFLWYKDYPQSNFHFYNDNDEWLLTDKSGHAFSSYYIGVAGYESLRWAGLDETKAVWFGGGLGFVFLTVVEVLDGFSAEWGASGGDLIANGLGSALFISQQLVWKEQKIKMKWSFHMSKYAQYNPKLLGSSFPERMLKDYNGQTVWLSANIHSFLHQDSRFPKWLNIAAGYGAEGMTGAVSNPSYINGVPLPHFDRYSQFYIAPDIDLSKINTRNKSLNLVLDVLGFFKFPLPAIEINKNGMKFHPAYF